MLTQAQNEAWKFGTSHPPQKINTIFNVMFIEKTIDNINEEGRVVLVLQII